MSVALFKAGDGVTSIVYYDGMTRGPVVRFPRVADALSVLAFVSSKLA